MLNLSGAKEDYTEDSVLEERAYWARPRGRGLLRRRDTTEQLN